MKEALEIIILRILSDILTKSLEQQFARTNLMKQIIFPNKHICAYIFFCAYAIRASQFAQVSTRLFMSIMVNKAFVL